MTAVPASPIVHLELHTGDLRTACAFYSQLLDWRTERINTASGTYQSLGLGGELRGGIVECGTTRSLWLPYGEVSEIATATNRARRLGASVLLEPREGPAGWRSVISTPAAGEIALWQQKGWRR